MDAAGPAPTNDGSGYIDLSAQDADSTNLIGLEVYLGQLAIFSSLVDTDSGRSTPTRR